MLEDSGAANTIAADCKGDELSFPVLLSIVSQGKFGREAVDVWNGKNWYPGVGQIHSAVSLCSNLP